MRRDVRVLWVALLVVLVACPGRVVKPAATSSSPRPVTASATPAVSAVFSAGRARKTIDALATVIGPREASSRRYRQAAAFMSNAFEQLGYQVRLQRVRIPAGKVNGTPVPAGLTYNVIAEPQGFDPTKPHAVVGGHLDTVPGAPGANDNASGVAMVLECARLATIQRPRLPMVFVAFGAEERRRQGPRASVYALGSRAYLRAQPPERARALRASVILDMVGAGARVHLLGRGAPVAVALAAARRLGVDAYPDATSLFSDHVAFVDARIPVVWFWAGDNPTFHTPADVPAIIQNRELRAIGRVAWETILTLRP